MRNKKSADSFDETILKRLSFPLALDFFIVRKKLLHREIFERRKLRGGLFWKKKGEKCIFKCARISFL